MSSRSAIGEIYQQALRTAMDAAREHPAPGQEEASATLSDLGYWRRPGSPEAAAAIAVALESLVHRVEEQARQITALKWRLDEPEKWAGLTASADEARATMAELGVPDEEAERLARAMVEGSDEEHDAAFGAVLADVFDRLETGDLQSAHAS